MLGTKEKETTETTMIFNMEIVNGRINYNYKVGVTEETGARDMHLGDVHTLIQAIDSLRRGK